MRITGDAPVIEVQQPAKEVELFRLRKLRDLNKVSHLLAESSNTLFQPGDIAFYLSAKQDLHAVAGKLRLQLAPRPARVAGKAAEGRADTRLGASPLHHNCVENLYAVEPVTLCFEEFAPLFDCGIDKGIAILGERNIGPIGFEEILVDVEAWPE